MTTKPLRALVLGAEPRIAVTIARSLHGHGLLVDVGMVLDEERVLRSKAVRRCTRFPHPRNAPDDFVAALCTYVRDREIDTVVPCSDTALSGIVLAHAELRNIAKLACPPPATIERVLDKSETLAAARAIGIDVPAEYPIAGAEDLARIADSLRFPLIAKPRDKAGLAGFKVRHFANAEALRATFDASPEFARSVLFQEFVPGFGYGIACLMRGGRALAAFAHVRVRELPFSGGVSVLSASAEMDQALLRKSIDLLRALEWEGVALVEFRRDPAGRTVLMEINGRYWGTLATAVNAGVDFPWYDWQTLHGGSAIVPPRYANGLRTRWSAGELLRFADVASARAGVVEPPAIGRELVAMLADFTPRVRDALWSPTDPRPAIDELASTSGHLIGSAFRALVKRLTPRRLREALQRIGFRALLLYGARRAARACRLIRPRSPNGRPIRSIVFVCSGNIMRSPFAERLLGTKLRAHGIDGVRVSSAGLSARTGKPADPRAAQAARAYGISLESHRAQLLTPAIVTDADVLVVMDYWNEAQLLSKFPRTSSKIYFLGSCSQSADPIDIGDPYDRDDAFLRNCFKRVAEKIDALSRMLSAQR